MIKLFIAPYNPLQSGTDKEVFLFEAKLFSFKAIVIGISNLADSLCLGPALHGL